MATALDRNTAEYRETFNAALTWTHGDEEQAHQLVETWSRVADEYELSRQADYDHEAGEHSGTYVEHCPQCNPQAGF